MASPDRDRGGFVTFPISLIGNPALEGIDYHMILQLDLLGWMGGERDGVVRESVPEIAARLKVSVASARRSLARLEALDPPLIARDSPHPNRRSLVRLLFDRYGYADTAGRGDSVEFESADHQRATPLQPDVICSDCKSADHGCNTGGVPIVTQSLTGERPILLVNIPPLQPPDLLGRSPVSDSDTSGNVGTADLPCPIVPPPPKTVADLIGWLPAITDDPAVLDRLRKKIPQWLSQLHGRRPDLGDEAISWVQDALTEASEKDDIPSFAARMLGIYHRRGGTIRAFVEATPDETDTPVPMPDWMVRNRGRLSGRPVSPATNAPDPKTSKLSRQQEKSYREDSKALLERWQSLTDAQRLRFEEEFDRDHPRPPEIPPNVWVLTRKIGCMECARDHHAT